MKGKIRTSTRASGGITEQEKTRMDEITKKWIAISYQTGRVNKKEVEQAIFSLYDAAGLKHPRVVIVPSPLVMACAYGLAAGIWYLRTDDATRAATDDATYDATRAATDDATYAATYVATYDATRAATDAATYDATRAATYAATRAATDDATRAATYAATRAATDDATWFIALARKISPSAWKFLLSCCENWTNVYQGGNMWAAFLAYAEAHRDILGLTGLPCWKKYQAWEDAAKTGGFRVLHPEFCLVSDFPVEIHTDSINRPHNDKGASHLWRDGFAIYHLNGVRMKAEHVLTPAEQLDPTIALTEPNADVQRELIRKIGAERMLKHCNAKTIDSFDDPHTCYNYKLMTMDIGENIRRKYLYFEHASLKGVFYAKPLPPETLKALHGRAWILSMIERNELVDIGAQKEQEILNNLTKYVS